MPADHHDSLQYIDALFDWTARHNLTVMLDLHGGPGSQNGIDHSGCGWSMGGPKWTQPTNIHLSLKVTPRLGPYQSPYLGPYHLSLKVTPSPTYSLSRPLSILI